MRAKQASRAEASIERLLVSFRDQPDFGDRGDWVIPRILEAGDIDDLLTRVAPRPVTVGRSVRADGTVA